MGKVAIRDINIHYHSCGENRPPEDAVELDFVKVDRARQLLHYDADFDRIGAITRPPTRWVVAQGHVS